MALESPENTQSRSGKGYRLTPGLRRVLSKPFGPVYRGASGVAELRSIIAKEKPARLIAIGDVVSAILNQRRIVADVYVVDHRIMRKPVKPIKLKVEKAIKAENPPSHITQDAWKAVEQALSSGKTALIEIAGEEDLLAIPAVLLAPVGSLVLYGQPREGIVALWVNEELKRRIEAIVDDMIVVGNEDQDR